MQAGHDWQDSLFCGEKTFRQPPDDISLQFVGKARLLCCAMSTTESYFSDVYWPPLEGCLLHFSLLSSLSRSGNADWIRSTDCSENHLRLKPVHQSAPITARTITHMKNDMSMGSMGPKCPNPDTLKIQILPVAVAVPKLRDFLTHPHIIPLNPSTSLDILRHPSTIAPEDWSRVGRRNHITPTFWDKPRLRFPGEIPDALGLW